MVGERRARLERTQDLVAGVLEVVLVELVDVDRWACARALLVQDDGALAHELHAERVEVLRPFVERLVERCAREVRVPFRGMGEWVGVHGRENPAVATTRLGPRAARVRPELSRRTPAS